MKKYLEILKKCALFDGIEEDQLLKMLVCLGARVGHFDKKYTVFAEGSPAKYIGILLSGSLQIVQVDYYGNRSIVSNIEERQIFGESFACAGVDSLPVYVVAATDADVMLMDVGRVTNTCCNACAFHNKIIYNLMKIMAIKNLAFHRRSEIISKRTTREKIMTYLMFEAKKNGKNTFSIPYDRQELADYLEVDRSGLSAEISKLRREGVLLCRKNDFTLLSGLSEDLK